MDGGWMRDWPGNTTSGDGNEVIRVGWDGDDSSLGRWSFDLIFRVLSIDRNAWIRYRKGENMMEMRSRSTYIPVPNSVLGECQGVSSRVDL